MAFANRIIGPLIGASCLPGFGSICLYNKQSDFPNRYLMLSSSHIQALHSLRCSVRTVEGELCFCNTWDGSYRHIYLCINKRSIYLVFSDLDSLLHFSINTSRLLFVIIIFRSALKDRIINNG